MVQPLGKVWQLSKVLKVQSPYDPAVPLLAV